MSFTFPPEVRSIERFMFSGCKDLEEVILPNGTQNICANAFDGCRHLRKLTIPESVRSVGYIGADSPQLKSLHCHGIQIKTKDWKEHIKDYDSVIYMIVRKDFDENIFPPLKYWVIYQMFLRNQDDENIYHYIKEHFEEIIKALIQDNQTELVQNYMKSFRRYTTAQNLDE